MLIPALVLTGVLLLVVNLIARGTGKLTAPSVLAVVGGFFGWPCVFFPALALTGGLTAVGGLVCGLTGDGPRRFLKCSLVAAVLAYAFVGLNAVPGFQEREALREQYPVESLAARLAYETRHRETHTTGEKKVSTPSGGGDHQALRALEDRVTDGWNLRRFHLARLHQDAVTNFINSPGFGITRRFEPSKEEIELPESAPIPLPPPASDLASAGGLSATSSSSPVEAVKAPQPNDLEKMHVDSLVDFANPGGFGDVQGRTKVRGFQAHQFRTMPEVGRWRVESLELVSLLTHDEPVVYLSKNLPRMDELRRARTRPLDPFEKGALAVLRRGEDLHTESEARRIRMLGSIRAGKPCLSCHDAERGDLLGAFSYTLGR